MATVQLNVRMNSSLKAEGDRALARAGYSPSETVRCVWSFARRHAADPNALRAFLRHLEAENEETRLQGEKDVAAHAQQLRAQLYNRIGIPLRSPVGLQTPASSDDLQKQVEQDKLLLAQAYAERSAERGL